MREAGECARETDRMGPVLRTGRDWIYERDQGLGWEDHQDMPYTKDLGETEDIREAVDFAGETAKMGHILKTGERVEI